jgi:hypothetical protein
MFFLIVQIFLTWKFKETHLTDFYFNRKMRTDNTYITDIPTQTTYIHIKKTHGRDLADSFSAFWSIPKVPLKQGSLPEKLVSHAWFRPLLKDRYTVEVDSKEHILRDSRMRDFAFGFSENIFIRPLVKNLYLSKFRIWSQQSRSHIWVNFQSLVSNPASNSKPFAIIF